MSKDDRAVPEKFVSEGKKPARAINKARILLMEVKGAEDGTAEGIPGSGADLWKPHEVRLNSGASNGLPTDLTHCPIYEYYSLNPAAV